MTGVRNGIAKWLKDQILKLMKSTKVQNPLCNKFSAVVKNNCLVKEYHVPYAAYHTYHIKPHTMYHNYADYLYVKNALMLNP